MFTSAIYEVAKIGEDIGTIPCAICNNLFSGNISVESWSNKGWNAIDEWLMKGSPE